MSTERNIRALDIAAQGDRVRVDALVEQVRVLQTAVANLTAEVGSLRVQLVTALAQRSGTGSTTR